ncbi:hypothetical protein BXZ70DRAFT_327739 [Cristinia sonorae]|uniref:FAD-binding PCMH-type domain-containing protein n=1 Tax=Cristinia sonorae TaxID=1940300 RepID=A0A8K0XNC9_9AGAR|nr:hypothetical protein BXZ70DRAFT_327739 [Cristinia sonorae]
MAPDIMPLELSTAIQEIQSICDAPNSRSEYFEYGSSGYKDSIRHFLASSSEVAQLAVQPGSVKDLCSIMNVLREHPTVQFAVKSGGHGMAPGLSSTTGIHISMTRFSKISYDADSQLAEIGSGCLWDQVYSQLASTGRNVVGGASSDGVGVGGSLLGGGYSLKSNRYGLGIDNIVAIEIVTPDGRARRVSLQREPDLFQALRGGGNNFGIVTKFTVRTFAQNPTYGAYFLIMGSRAEAFKKAMVEYVENEERQEACVVAAFRHELVRGKADPEYTISIFCVYDAEKPKKRSNVPFQEFSRLQKSGDVWKADPAGWQLGKTQLSISDGSLKHRTPQSTSHNHKTAPHRPHQRRNGAGHHHEDDSDNESIFSSAFEEMSFNRFYNVSSRPPAASNDRSTAYDSDEYSLTSSRGSPVTYDDTDDLDSSDGADQLSDSDDPPPEYSSNLDDSDDDRSSPPRPASNYRSKRHKDEDSDSEDGPWTSPRASGTWSSRA